MRAAITSIAVAVIGCVAACVGACTPEKPVGTCNYWDECGEGGACEYIVQPFSCSFADDTCPSGRRFGEYAPADRAERCVDFMPHSDGLCDEAHPCDSEHRCELGRCINVDEVIAGEELVATTCIGDRAFWLWGVPIQLTQMTGAITPAPWASQGFGAASVTLGVRHLCIVTTLGQSECFCPSGDPFLVGAGSAGDPNFVTNPGGPYDRLSAAIDHTCGMRGNAISCWGHNASAQLDGTPGADSMTARTTAFSGPVTHVAAGTTFSCGATATEIRCWGGMANWFAGTLGSGGVVQGLPSAAISSLSAGERHACAVIGTNVWCWGANDAGQTTGNATTAPAVATRVGDARSVAAGKDHTCAVLPDRTVSCWGANGRGQLGAAGGPAPVTVPLAARALGPIAAGDGFTCALLEDSFVHCWGAEDIVRPAGSPPLDRVVTCID